jgi:aminopeptidase-like protein
VKPAALGRSFGTCVAALEVLEHNRRYRNQNPKGEPHLNRRGLYGAMGGQSDARTFQRAVLWVLNLSDGKHTLLDIARRADTPFRLIKSAAEALIAQGLLCAN